MVGNVIVQCELLLILIFQFLRPQENMKFLHGGHFVFQWNFKKITSHLHIVGNVIVKFK